MERIKTLSTSPAAPPSVVYVTAAGVAAFMAQWPCSNLDSGRGYAFDFDSAGDLVDSDLPESDDGPAASAMADDCRAYLLEGKAPAWAAGAVAKLAPVYGLMAAYRPYACECCGQVQTLQTNHTGPLSGVCPGCNARGLELPTVTSAPWAGKFPRRLSYAGPPVRPQELNPVAQLGYVPPPPGPAPADLLRALVEAMETPRSRKASGPWLAALAYLQGAGA